MFYSLLLYLPDLSLIVVVALVNSILWPSSDPAETPNLQILPIPFLLLLHVLFYNIMKHIYFFYLIQLNKHNSSLSLKLRWDESPVASADVANGWLLLMMVLLALMAGGWCWWWLMMLLVDFWKSFSSLDVGSSPLFILYHLDSTFFGCGCDEGHNFIINYRAKK